MTVGIKNTSSTFLTFGLGYLSSKRGRMLGVFEFISWFWSELMKRGIIIFYQCK
jgi:hypothetical protein